MEEESTFDVWLSLKLKSLGIDEKVCGDSIKSILESDESPKQKFENLDFFLAENTPTDVATHNDILEEIWEQWELCLESDAPSQPQKSNVDRKSISVDRKSARVMEKPLSVVPQKKLKLSHAEVSDGEDEEDYVEEANLSQSNVSGVKHAEGSDGEKEEDDVEEANLSEYRTGGRELSRNLGEAGGSSTPTPVAQSNISGMDRLRLKMEEMGLIHPATNPARAQQLDDELLTLFESYQKPQQILLIEGLLECIGRTDFTMLREIDENPDPYEELLRKPVLEIISRMTYSSSCKLNLLKEALIVMIKSQLETKENLGEGVIGTLAVIAALRSIRTDSLPLAGIFLTTANEFESVPFPEGLTNDQLALRKTVSDGVSDLAESFLKRQWWDLNLFENDNEANQRIARLRNVTDPIGEVRNIIQEIVNSCLKKGEGSRRLSKIKKLGLAAISVLGKGNSATSPYPTCNKHTYKIFFRTVLQELVAFSNTLQGFHSADKSILPLIQSWEKVLGIVDHLMSGISATDDVTILDLCIKSGGALFDLVEQSVLTKLPLETYPNNCNEIICHLKNATRSLTIVFDQRQKLRFTGLDSRLAEINKMRKQEDEQGEANPKVEPGPGNRKVCNDCGYTFTNYRYSKKHVCKV